MYTSKFVNKVNLMLIVPSRKKNSLWVKLYIWHSNGIVFYCTKLLCLMSKILKNKIVTCYLQIIFVSHLYIQCFIEKKHSVQFSCSVVSDSLQPHGLQHARPPCPSPTPSLVKVMSTELVMPSNHLILCHSLSSCLQSFPSSGSFQMSQFFASGGQSSIIYLEFLKETVRTTFISICLMMNGSCSEKNKAINNDITTSKNALIIN